MNKPHIYLHGGQWFVAHERGTAISDSVEAAWNVYLSMVEKDVLGYYTTPGSSLLTWAGK